MSLGFEATAVVAGVAPGPTVDLGSGTGGAAASGTDTGIATETGSWGGLCKPTTEAVVASSEGFGFGRFFLIF